MLKNCIYTERISRNVTRKNRLISPDDFLKKHGFLRMSDVFDILLDDFINSEKEKTYAK